MVRPAGKSATSTGPGAIRAPSPDGRDAHAVLSAWARIGAGFNVEPASAPPDLEQLIIDTTRFARGNARLFTMAVTWLVRYGELVARHRLRRLAIDQLGPTERAVLGCMLDCVRLHSRSGRFGEVIDACPALDRVEPLFDVHARDPRLVERVRRRADPWSVRWNLLAEAVELNFDALRPAAFVMRRNPAFAARADLGGDVRASILASLAQDPDAGRSELELARRCGAARPAVHRALERLELAGRIRRCRCGKCRSVVLVGAGG